MLRPELRLIFLAACLFTLTRAQRMHMQVVLFDVRRMSSSSIINFGSSRAGKQVVATFNLRARAEEAGYGSSGSLHGVLPGRGGSFLDHVALNPADAQLLAYVRPDLQVGVGPLR